MVVSYIHHLKTTKNDHWVNWCFEDSINDVETVTAAIHTHTCSDCNVITTIFVAKSIANHVRVYCYINYVSVRYFYSLFV